MKGVFRFRERSAKGEIESVRERSEGSRVAYRILTTMVLFIDFKFNFIDQAWFVQTWDFCVLFAQISEDSRNISISWFLFRNLTYWIAGLLVLLYLGILGTSTYHPKEKNRQYIAQALETHKIGKFILEANIMLIWRHIWMTLGS